MVATGMTTPTERERWARRFDEHFETGLTDAEVEQVFRERAELTDAQIAAAVAAAERYAPDLRRAYFGGHYAAFVGDPRPCPYTDRGEDYQEAWEVGWVAAHDLPGFEQARADARERGTT